MNNMPMLKEMMEKRDVTGTIKNGNLKTVIEIGNSTEIGSIKLLCEDLNRMDETVSMSGGTTGFYIEIHK